MNITKRYLKQLIKEEYIVLLLEEVEPADIDALRGAAQLGKDALKKIWRNMARKYHPDKGGSDEDMAEINSLFNFLKDNPDWNPNAIEPWLEPEQSAQPETPPEPEVPPPPPTPEPPEPDPVPTSSATSEPFNAQSEDPFKETEEEKKRREELEKQLEKMRRDGLTKSRIRGREPTKWDEISLEFEEMTTKSISEPEIRLKNWGSGRSTIKASQSYYAKEERDFPAKDIYTAEVYDSRSEFQDAGLRRKMKLDQEISKFYHDRKAAWQKWKEDLEDEEQIYESTIRRWKKLIK
jgi:hypothetical protein